MKDSAEIVRPKLSRYMRRKALCAAFGAHVVDWNKGIWRLRTEASRARDEQRHRRYLRDRASEAEPALRQLQQDLSEASWNADVWEKRRREQRAARRRFLRGVWLATQAVGDFGDLWVPGS